MSVDYGSISQIKQGLEALGHEVDMVGDRIDCFYVYGDDNRKVFKSHYKPMLEANLPAKIPIFSDNGSGMLNLSGYVWS